MFKKKDRRLLQTFVASQNKNLKIVIICTGKSLSEALIFVEHGENMLYVYVVANVKSGLE